VTLKRLICIDSIIVAQNASDSSSQSFTCLGSFRFALGAKVRTDVKKANDEAKNAPVQMSI